MPRANKKKVPRKMKKKASVKTGNSSEDAKKKPEAADSKEKDDKSKEGKAAEKATEKKGSDDKQAGKEAKGKEAKGKEAKIEAGSEKTGKGSGKEAATEFSTISEVDLENDADITSLYDVDDEGPVDMTKMEQRHGRGRKIAIAAAVIIILLGAVAYLGYRIFNKGFGETNINGDVEFSLSIEDKVASGDVVTIEVEYENKKNVALSTGTIEVIYPDGFYFQSASPEASAESNRLFEIKNVQPGAGGKIRITGQLVGVKGEDKEITALMTYQPKNFSHDFQETAEATVHITSSIVELNVDVPSQVQSGQEMTYKVEFTNTAKLPLQNVKILMGYPEGFTYSSSSLEPHGINTEWRIESLEPNETQTLSIDGTIEGESGDTKEFNFQLGLIELDNTFNVQMEQTSLVVIVNPEIDLSIEASDLVRPGDEVPVKVTVKNTSEAELSDVKVKLEMDGELFKDSEYKFDTIKKLSPQDSEELEHTITLKNKDDAKQELTLTATVTSAVVEGNEVSFPNSAEAIMKVRGSFAVIAEGRYFDDDLTKIGSGPLPPVVNQETTYIIRWTITNGANQIEDLWVTTTLPDSVIWIKDASKAIEYDSSTRQVSYTKDKVQANTEVDLEFSVTVAPTNDDLNKLLVLTGETVVSAVDKFTGEEISQQLDRITTDLPNDEGAKGKGVVEGS
ncbi:CARDB domain-containing protein [Patescibacteria group bacterium]